MMQADTETDRDEFLWVELNETAAADFNAGQFAVADEIWRKAFAIAQQFAANDPRLACSLNNVAIGHRLTGNFAQAEEHYEHAIASWQTASVWVDKMHLAPRARSSLFHLRMEQKHKQKYRRIAITKYQALLPAGQAATHNNLAELYHSTNRQHLAETLYAQALRDRSQAMGADEPIIEIIRENARMLRVDGPHSRASHRVVHPGSFSAEANGKGWIIDRPAEFTDEGRLMAALLLTSVLDHRRVSSLS